MADLVALKVKIGIIETGRRAGKHKYPDFDSIDSTIRKGIPWQEYVDKFGTGWHYDSGGHDADTIKSPFGERFGMLLVPQDFAGAALAAFPTTVTRLTEAEAEDFFDNDAHNQDSDVSVDAERLVPIQIKLQRNIALSPADLDALDPTSKTAGVVNNPRRTWARYKALLGFTLR